MKVYVKKCIYTMLELCINSFDDA